MGCAGSSTTGQSSPKFGIEQRELASLPAGHEDQAAGLPLDQTLQQPALLGGQLAVTDADVAQKNDVEFRELVEPRRKLLDVILIAASPLAQSRMEQSRHDDFDARIAGEGVAQIAVFPPRIRLDDEHFQFLFADRDGRRAAIVVDQRFVGIGGTASFTVKSPTAFGFHRIESLVRAIGAMCTSFESSSPLDVRSVTVVTYSRGSELSMVNGIRTDFADHAEGRRVEAEHFDVGESRRAADR